MAKLHICKRIALALAGALCAVNAWAADIPVKAPPAAAASAPQQDEQCRENANNDYEGILGDQSVTNIGFPARE
jgi:hypothetical protein